MICKIKYGCALRLANGFEQFWPDSYSSLQELSLTLLSLMRIDMWAFFIFYFLIFFFLWFIVLSQDAILILGATCILREEKKEKKSVISELILLNHKSVLSCNFAFSGSSLSLDLCPFIRIYYFWFCIWLLNKLLVLFLFNLCIT